MNFESLNLPPSPDFSKEMLEFQPQDRHIFYRL